MTYTLFHGSDSSAIVAVNTNNEHVASIEYTTKTHKYMSQSDLATINTEMLTYGEKAAHQVFEYMRSTR